MSSKKSDLHDFCRASIHTNLEKSADTKFKGIVISTNFFKENYKDLKVRSDADLETIEYAMEGNSIKSTGVEVIEQN